MQCDESSAERDTKSKQSDESSNEQSVKSKTSDECCVENVVEKSIDNNHVDELDVESNFKSFGFRNGVFSSKRKPIEKINFEETLNSSLPEHLRLLVKKHLDDLRMKGKEES